LIEDKASGIQLIQELIREGLHAVTRYQPQSDKVMRMHAQTAMIENGFVRVPDAASWLTQYLHELMVVPSGKHDDQVDSTAQMLDWFRRASGPISNTGMFELYRQRAEELRRGQAPCASARLRSHAASRACSCFQASAGTWPPTARSRCQKQMPRRCCGLDGRGSTSATPPRQEAAIQSDNADERIFFGTNKKQRTALRRACQQRKIGTSCAIDSARSRRQSVPFR
jgi:hypothetical protein